MTPPSHTGPPGGADELAEEPDGAELLRSALARLEDRGAGKERYRLEGEIGRGGMGAVIRVWDDDLRRHLAMKVMLGPSAPHSTGATPPVDLGRLARFLEEAQVTGQLDHPGIVPVHELGLDSDGHLFFTMKLVRGRTLQEVFDDLHGGAGVETQTRVLGLVQRVCEAMSYAHAKGVIHRDLKPANVMVGRFGEVYVMDWGLARVLDATAGARRAAEPADLSSGISSVRWEQGTETPSPALHTQEGDVVGTPAYMSPEQARGRVEEVGTPSDVYAVGAMLYHLLAGRPPPADPRAPLGAEHALHAIAPWTPAEIEAICERAMAFDPRERYPDMSALAADMSAYLEGRVVSAYETGAFAEARKWVRRNRALASALLAGVLALAGGLVSSLILKGRADDNAALAEEETVKVLRLSDGERFKDLSNEEELLWPPHPDRIADLERWLKRARALVGRLPLHRATLEEMRASAAPWSQEERLRDRADHPKAAELESVTIALEDLRAELEVTSDLADLEAGAAYEAHLEVRMAELKAQVSERRTFRFPSTEEQWHHGVLTDLIGRLEWLEEYLLAQDAVPAGLGWSVPKRLAFAHGLERDFAPGGMHHARWSEALPELRAAYPGLEIGPQIGLVPIGPDPASGLWEFAHLVTGEPAERGPDGRLRLEEDTGVVLVLIPGGTFWMGAQGTDRDGHNYDPEALESEGPVHEVELSPYFLSKYELTQGQWLRLTGDEPSQYGPENWGTEWLDPPREASLLHPVEMISWSDCEYWLPSAGLALPTEAQWEFAMRADTDTPWWTGEDRESLRGAANLLDAHARGFGAGGLPGHELWLDDGATVHAPIGTYAANGLGLHEMAGNLWEWCLDAYDGAFYFRSPRLDPVCPPEARAKRVNRGGCYGASAAMARSADRNGSLSNAADGSLGVRPARPLER